MFTSGFNEVFPYYLSIGMTADEFWNGDPKLVVAYRKADDMRKQRLSEEMWLQGLYIYDAVRCVAAQALKKKGSKPPKYMSEPIRLIPYTETEKAIIADRERKKTIEYFNRLAKRFEAVPSAAQE